MNGDERLGSLRSGLWRCCVVIGPLSRHLNFYIPIDLIRLGQCGDLCKGRLELGRGGGFIYSDRVALKAAVAGDGTGIADFSLCLFFLAPWPLASLRMERTAKTCTVGVRIAY